MYFKFIAMKSCRQNRASKTCPISTVSYYLQCKTTMKKQVKRKQHGSKHRFRAIPRTRYKGLEESTKIVLKHRRSLGLTTEDVIIASPSDKSKIGCFPKDI